MEYIELKINQMMWFQVTVSTISQLLSFPQQFKCRGKQFLI